MVDRQATDRRVDHVYRNPTIRQSEIETDLGIHPGRKAFLYSGQVVRHQVASVPDRPDSDEWNAGIHDPESIEKFPNSCDWNRCFPVKFTGQMVISVEALQGTNAVAFSITARRTRKAGLDVVAQSAIGQPPSRSLQQLAYCEAHLSEGVRHLGSVSTGLSDRECGRGQVLRAASRRETGCDHMIGRD